MPQDTGALSVQEQDQVNAWLSEKCDGQIPECPISGPTTWLLAEHVLTPLPFMPKGQVFSGRSTVYPLLMFVCTDCGYSFFVSAETAGIVIA